MWKRLDPKIATSEKHAKFGFSPLTLWVMMLPHTDSQGRYWANPSYIKGQCLPLFEHVRLEQIEQALLELQEVRLLHLYDSDGKRYLVYHDVEDFNPPGALRYQRPQWPDPPSDLCKCLSRRESGVLTPLVSSSSSSSSSEEGFVPPEDREQPDSPESRLYKLALKAKLRAISDRQLRSYVGGWLAAKGYQFVEELLMSSAVRGMDVLDVNTKFFREDRNAKPAKRKVHSPTCQKCQGSGRRSNPVTGGQMDCVCVREIPA